MVRTRWELATNASTTTCTKEELDTPSATCASSERTFIFISLAIRNTSGQISINIMQK